MIVEVELKQVWAEKRAYPRNETAQLFSELLNKKTFDEKQLKKINDLGYEIKFIAPTFKEWGDN